MKKYLVRIVVGLLTFSIGIFTVWLWFSEVVLNNYCKLTPTSGSKVTNEAVLKELTGKVEVRFNGFISTKDEHYAEFIVENNTKDSLFYKSYGLNENESVGFPLYEVKVDRKKFDQMWCGTGLMTYEIKSGESKHFRVSVWGFTYRLKRLENVQIGFNLSNSTDKDAQTFWSQSFAIPDKIRKDILKKTP